MTGVRGVELLLKEEDPGMAGGLEYLGSERLEEGAGRMSAGGARVCFA